MTPRRRIVVRRALQRLEKENNKADHQQLLQEYQFDGVDTCAVDGLCALECPVEINTGDLVKRLRRESHSKNAKALALLLAKHFSKVESIVKMALNTGNLVNKVLGKKTMKGLTKTIRVVIPEFPIWTDQLTGPIKTAAHQSANPSAVFSMPVFPE